MISEQRRPAIALRSEISSLVFVDLFMPTVEEMSFAFGFVRRMTTLM